MYTLEPVYEACNNGKMKETSIMFFSKINPNETIFKKQNKVEKQILTDKSDDISYYYNELESLVLDEKNDDLLMRIKMKNSNQIREFMVPKDMFFILTSFIEKFIYIGVLIPNYEVKYSFLFYEIQKSNYFHIPDIQLCIDEFENLDKMWDYINNYFSEYIVLLSKSHFLLERGYPAGFVERTIVNIQKDKINKEINDAVIDYMDENNVSAYDERSHKGIVRRVFTRKSFSANEIMVVVSVNAKSLPKREKLISKLRKVSDRIVSIVLNINTKRNNLVLTEENVILWGKDRISDTLCGVKFDISPQSFFQINPVQTEKLYSKALEYADIDENTSVMDIYCGIGTISLCAAKNAKSVVGVEIVERAIEDAKENAVKNGIENAIFYADSAENIVPKLIEKGERPDVVILDPPRKGSDESTLTAIIKAQPKRVVYVSCNPATLARDARFLNDNGYTITATTAFDLFPHTSHVETVCLMKKKY